MMSVSTIRIWTSRRGKYYESVHRNLSIGQEMQALGQHYVWSVGDAVRQVIVRG
jgi:hypothetical protein